MRTLSLIRWWVFALLAIAIGLYPIIYFLSDEPFGLLLSKPQELLLDQLWNIGFYGHVLFGGSALLLGWSQFSKKLRNRNVQLHRLLGKGYVISVLISGICSVYIGFFATGGWISGSGFITLGLIWLMTTSWAFLAIRKGDTELHEKLMIFSYAACFAAVTLRLYMPILINLYGEFIPAYRTVAWLCWMPNMIYAFYLVRKKHTPAPDVIVSNQ